ncbi:MAG: chorismate synthase [Clostridia bacterium]|nr:chorismate synthase [Clostridia bacterium]
MKNTFGSSLTVTLFGESHGEMIGAVLDGVAPGIKIDNEYISSKLEQRKPHGRISTQRKEADEYRIVSGVFEGYTTGTPICILIPNASQNSNDYKELKTTPRPSHADYTAGCKYLGYQDYRGGGHFSGRVTAALVAAGAILSLALENKGIKIGTHISRLHGISDRHFGEYESDIDKLNFSLFPVLDSTVKERMEEDITTAAQSGDSVGGVLETALIGLPAGVGEPWFDTLEGTLSHILFSVPGIKGVEFGAGFALADMLGSEANDAFSLDGDKVVTKTNNNGGINGGISNGMPIVFRCAVKPTPSIFKSQSTLNLSTMKEEELVIHGRHDPAIIHRARAVVDAVSALAVADLLTVRFGTDFFSKGGEKI